MLRWVLATLLVAAVWLSAPAHADDPQRCPPTCDSIPTAAWIDPDDIPMRDTYQWPALHEVDVVTIAPRFRFEELCGIPPVMGDPRSYAVSSKAVVDPGPGHWQLHAQVLHWRGDIITGGSTALAMVQAASDAVRACQRTAPAVSPSITTDQPGMLAVVFSGPVVVHQYLVAHPNSSTVSELAFSASPPPLVGWAGVVDGEVLDAMVTPLCAAYVSSCG